MSHSLQDQPGGCAGGWLVGERTEGGRGGGLRMDFAAGGALSLLEAGSGVTPPFGRHFLSSEGISKSWAQGQM